jgi:predicted membrane GTPase involved in stress response
MSSKRASLASGGSRPPTNAETGSQLSHLCVFCLSPLQPIRNVSVIAHVDHGKTSLTDKLLRFCDPTFTDSMDSNPLERERGITILAKCTSFKHKPEGAKEEIHFNIVDTPGHADFGSEVR